MTGHDVGVLALGVAIGIQFAQLVHTIRRHRKFAQVRAAYLKAKADGTGKGLFLEHPASPGQPSPGNPFSAGTRSQGKNAEHVCSFIPCPHLQREADRRAQAARFKDGAA